MTNISTSQEQRYVQAKGGNCPHCGSPNLEAMHSEIWLEDRIVDPIVCLDCGKTWADVYVLTFILPYPQEEKYV